MSSPPGRRPPRPDAPELLPSIPSPLVGEAAPTYFDSDDGLEPSPSSGGNDLYAIVPPVADSRRYEILELIGQGGVGDVHRALDRTLRRVVAIKMLRANVAASPAMVRRFIQEAQIVAQLEHPAIVPVHELGRTEDGRWFITMKEVQGRTLRELIGTSHPTRAASQRTSADAWNMRRLIEAFRTVCSAVGFAHARGALHRDLKPDNIMVGDFGEVLVVDWGLARFLDDGLPQGEEATSGGSPTDTHLGAVVGTPAYMSPEQARSVREEQGPWSDVWALGGILYTILYGMPPYRGSAVEVLDQVRKGPPSAPHDAPPPPDELVAIWTRAMQMTASSRYRDANEMLTDLDAWVDGAAARDRALRLVTEARRRLPQLNALQVSATRMREKARASVVALRAGDPIGAKEAAWALEDEHERLRDEVENLWLDVSNQARLALTHSPGMPEARRLLADLYHERSARAEADQDRAAAREYRMLLAEVDDGAYAAFLRSDAEVALITEPAGARVRARRYAPLARRLVAQPFLPPGPPPLRGVRLPVGSYLIELTAPGRELVRLPLHNRRGAHWSHVRPGASRGQPVWLPPSGTLLEKERLVTAGWFVAGGDGEALGALPRQRLWLDDYTIATHPITHGDYLDFLNALVAGGQFRIAERHLPRYPDRRTEREVALYRRDEGTGRYALPVELDVQGIVASPTTPVVHVSWHDAMAYCHWLAAVTGLPWRLPGELEREKAGRGVDGREYPWGSFADPVFFCMQDSFLGQEGPPSVDEFNIDTSPYGVRWLAGGVQEWCADVWRPDGPPRRGSLVVQPDPPQSADLTPHSHEPRRVVRGGAWNMGERAGRCASRAGQAPSRRSSNLGFRVARTLVASE
jgi:eukaryotic-like serine/threonine-protein kinase